jgi:predicted enzyme related to lactoylglutathione lyase
VIPNLDFVVLRVPNIEQARAFYTEKLGLTVEDEQPGFVQFRRSGGLEGASFALAENPSATPHAGVTLWWRVEDAAAAHDAFTARGIPIVNPLQDRPFGRIFAISDPAGNTIELYQPPLD